LRVKGAASGGSSIFTDTDFTVGAGGQTVFTSSAFTAGSKIDDYRHGALVREGAANDWQRSGTTTITFNYTVLQNAWVKVRVWN
jgi:hypothetical protein